MSQQELDADLSQLSNKSFITSLGDDELLELINKLSQRRQAPAPHPTDTEEDTEHDTEQDTDVDEALHAEIQEDILPTNIPPLDTDDSGVQESTLSLPLAQPPESDQSLSGSAQDPNEKIIFGDYESYFANKAHNQQIEDEKYLEWDRKRREVQGIDAQRSDIFQGCVIYVNGHTKPSIATIHKLVILHGGKFIHHLSAKGAATHVIASRLTPRKRLEFKNYKVVRPEWVTDSVDKGKRMRWQDYTVINNEYGQKQLPFNAKISEEENDNDLDDEGERRHLNDDDGPQESEPAPEDLEDVETDLKPLTQPADPITTTEEVTITIDAKHPDFLKTFFAKSRLHHLSTWKADLRAEFLAKAMKQATSKPRTQRTGTKLIMHVDFDCFFATASALKHPDIDFKNTPVCVSHGGSSASSTADIASCNYVCRKFGVRNGMWIRSAKKLCPELVCLDYDFPTYEKISKEFYEILLELQSDCILPVSIDEALLEVTSLIHDPSDLAHVENFAQSLRQKIYDRTKCTASIGISFNVLLAKLSLRRAKPDGFFYLHDNIQDFIDNCALRDLPGAGGSIEQKLINELFPHGSTRAPSVYDLRGLDKSKLEKLYGIKTAQKLYDYARGVDHTSIDIAKDPQQFMRKSVSIDINWGIRFDTIQQIDTFLFDVGKEISSKLIKINMVASQVTLKVLKRAKHAPVEPPKFLGCGECDAFSKSSRLGVGTDEYRIIGTEARALFRHIGCDPKELRGVSIQVSKLSVKKNDNQKRLPFSKIDYETYKKQKVTRESEIEKAKENTDGVLDQNTTHEEQADSTQYDIPADVDSSILNELPSSVQAKIRKQHDRDLQSVAAIPKEVDLKVFNQLPEEIQGELREELRRRNIQINPRTPSKSKKIYLQQLFTSTSQPSYVRVVSPRKSPSKRKLRSPSKSPEKINVPSSMLNPPPALPPLRPDDIDESVLAELPSSIRANILQEWEAYEAATKTEYAKLKERIPIMQHDPVDRLILASHFTRLVEPLEFQKKRRPAEVVKLVSSWIAKTKAKGPHKDDLRLFEEYMNSIKTENYVFYLGVVKRMTDVMESESDVCDMWWDVLGKLTGA